MASSSRLACVTGLTALAAAAVLAAGTAWPTAGSAQVGERQVGPIVDFVAVQADGTPVGGLQPSEVEIRINGRLRTLRAIRRVTAAAPPVAPDEPPRLPAPFGTNDDVAAGRSLAIVVDEESFVAGREQLLRSAVEGLLADFTPADRAAVIVLPYTGVKAAFTADTARIRLAMDGIAGQGVRDETGSDLACRTRRFLDALAGFLHGQAGRSSPLTVVLFTAGLAAPRRDAPMLAGPGMCELLVTHFERIALTAGEARANLFVVIPDDLGAPGERWRESIGGTGYLGSNNPLEGIEHLEGATRAVRLPLDATGTGALQRVAREGSAYYEAELAPERDEAFGRSVSLDVRVLRRDVTVRARPAITFPRPASAPATPRLSLSDLLLSGHGYADLPLRVAGFTVRQADGQLRVGIVAEPADPGATLAALGAVLVDRGGRVLGRWFAPDPGVRPVLGAMVVPAGTYRLRVAGIDAGGRFGAAEAAVRVGLTTVGPLWLGSLVLGLSRDDGMVPRLQFGGEATAIASFDIYDGAVGMQISASLELARTVSGPAMASLPLTLTREADGRVTATGAVPIGALAPGDYTLRGIVRLEDGTTGHVTRTLRKAAR